MVTYSVLIQIGILIVGICSLVFQISKKKWPSQVSRSDGRFF